MLATTLSCVRPHRWFASSIFQRETGAKLAAFSVARSRGDVSYVIVLFCAVAIGERFRSPCLSPAAGAGRKNRTLTLGNLNGVAAFAKLPIHVLVSIQNINTFNRGIADLGRQDGKPERHQKRRSILLTSTAWRSRQNRQVKAGPEGQC